MTTKFQLEPAARAVAEATSKPPFLFRLGPEKGRAGLDEVQSGSVNKPQVDIEDRVISGGPDGQVSIRIIRPPNATNVLPVIVYIHGAGWVFGNNHTHDRLIRELAVGAEAVVVFPNYSLSPEAKYPTALEECYATVEWIAKQGLEIGLNPQQLAIAGDSCGGCIVAAVALLSKERGGPKISHQLLFYPVTNSDFNTESYLQFAEGYFLRRDAMMWFWDQYTNNLEEREQITVSPLKASIEQLTGLPPTLVITGEVDVLRDEGEAYANKLREAGVRVTAVRFQGIIHDFVMLNALADTAATRGAMTLAIDWLRQGFANQANKNTSA